MTELNINNTIIVVIAPARKPEQELLFKGSWREGNDWTYVAVDTDGNVTNSDGLDKSLFILINQCQDLKDIKSILQRAGCLNKNVIVRTHKTKETKDGNYDAIPCESKNKILNFGVFDCDGFSHTAEKPFLKFMKSFGENNKCWENRKQILIDFIKECAGKKTEFNTRSLLSLFLPLDIDMQALAILAGNENKNLAVKYLQEMYSDGIDYFQKFEELKTKMNEISGIERNRLSKLTNSKACEFFKNLQNKESSPEKILNHSWDIEGKNSFHDWFCALAD